MNEPVLKVLVTGSPTKLVSSHTAAVLPVVGATSGRGRYEGSNECEKGTVIDANVQAHAFGNHRGSGRAVRGFEVVEQTRF